MRSRRFVSLSILAAVLVLCSLVGIPRLGEEPLGNFSGHAVYTAGTGSVDLNGRYTLYGLKGGPSRIRMVVYAGGKALELGVDAAHGTFSGSLDAGLAAPCDLKAVLEVENKAVARGNILLPAPPPPGVHIIRFASF